MKAAHQWEDGLLNGQTLQQTSTLSTFSFNGVTYSNLTDGSTSTYDVIPKDKSVLVDFGSEILLDGFYQYNDTNYARAYYLFYNESRVVVANGYSNYGLWTNGSIFPLRARYMRVYPQKDFYNNQEDLRLFELALRRVNSLNYNYSGGLLDGKTMYLSTGVTGGTATALGTDNNINTFINVNASNLGAHTLYSQFLPNGQYAMVDKLRMEISDVSSSYQPANGLAVSSNIDVLLYRDGTLVSTITNPLVDNREFDIPNIQANKVAIRYKALDAGIMLYEFQLYEFIPPDTTPPSVPSNVVVVGLDSQIQLSWSPSTDDRSLRGYRVFQDGVFLTEVASPLTGYLTTGLTNNHTYSFQVSAVDASNNESARSSPTIGTPVESMLKYISTGVNVLTPTVQVQNYRTPVTLEAQDFLPYYYGSLSQTF